MCLARITAIKLLMKVMKADHSAMQNIALPLGYSSKDTAPIKRFAEDLRKLGCRVSQDFSTCHHIYQTMR